MGTKRQFLNTLLDAGIQFVTVTSGADWAGGRQHHVYFEQVDVEELADFAYIEGEFDVTACVKNRKREFVDTYEPQYGGIIEESHTLEELVLSALNE